MSSSISKACIELSNSIKGFRLSRGSPPAPTPESPPPVPPKPESISTGSGASNIRAASTVTSTISRAIKSATRAFETQRNGHVPATQALVKKPAPNPWTDDKFLAKFFLYFSPCDKCVLVQVCKQWRDLLYEPHHWIGVTPIAHCRDWTKDPEARTQFFDSLDQRGFDSIILFGATDWDINDIVNNFVPSRKLLKSVSLRCSNVSDTGIESLVEKVTSLYKLELSGCNEITEAGLWASLNSKIVSLTITDCINVADDSVGAIAQLLPLLYELNLQAYHVTDAALSFFSAKQSYTLNILRLQSCWEVTNHGIVNIVHSLPNLSVLSLSGCSKITDDGVELIAENLRKLRSLDLSWCPRITDAALEYIACDLAQLEELTLDRCCHITDIGVGYLSTMTCLLRLFLRWCTQLRDFGLQHLYTMKGLQVLSLAGCSLVTSSGLTGLIQLRSLEELELTNCPGATPDICHYLKDNMPHCLVIE